MQLRAEKGLDLVQLFSARCNALEPHVLAYVIMYMQVHITGGVHKHVKVFLLLIKVVTTKDEMVRTTFQICRILFV